MLWLVVLYAAASGCSALGYYSQAARGQLALLAARTPIAELLARPDTDALLRSRLQLVLSVRKFAEQRMALPVGARYADYVELQRPYPVWNVFAAPELSLTPREWCYPIIGCAVYRGYFARADADAEAARLHRAGMDVYVSGVLAYSTLGWFDDPVLSSFLALREDELIGLILHESAHSLVFVESDSRFNEGFASYVEQEGLRLWYREHGDDAGLARAAQARQVRDSFLAFMLGWRAQLAALYASPLDAAAKRSRKRELQDAMLRAYRASTAPFAHRYDSFFTSEVNNARLATLSTYYDLLPAFASLQRRAGSLPLFYDRVRALAQLPAAARSDALAAATRDASAQDNIR